MGPKDTTSGPGGEKRWGGGHAAPSKSGQKPGGAQRGNHQAAQSTFMEAQQGQAIDRDEIARHDETILENVRAAVRNRENPGDPDSVSEGVLRAKVLELGYRASFSDLDTKSKVFHVETNHFTLQPPNKIWVYSLDMTRQFATPRGDIKVKKLADKLLIMDAVAQGSNSFNVPSTSWITDGDLLWSTQQFAQIDLSTPGRIANFWYQNELGVPLEIARIEISFQQVIQCTLPMTQLFYDGSATTWNKSVPAVLMRGLNAFLTRHARARHDLYHPSSNGRFYTKAANDHRDLDRMVRAIKGFSVSTRPGTENLILNINTTTSPFFKRNITVSSFIRSQHASGASLKSIIAALKGVKVRLLYDLDNSQVTPAAIADLKSKGVQHQPEENRKFRSISEIAAASEKPKIGQNEDQKASDRTTTALKWFTSVYGLEDPPGALHPSQQSTCMDDYFVNIGKSSQSAFGSGGAVWIPGDKLEIVEFQSLRGLLSPPQTNGMVRFAELNPATSKGRILSNGLQMLGINQHGQQALLQNNGIIVGRNMMRVPAFRLTPPTLQYANKQQFPSADNANWNLVGVKFTRSPVMTRLLFFNTINLNPHSWLQNLSTQLSAHGLLGTPGQSSTWESLSNNGMQGIGRYDQPRSPEFDKTLEGHLKAYKNAGRSDVVLVLLQKDFDVYSSIKCVAEIRLGLRTICMQPPKGTYLAAQHGSNIALKYALKTNIPCHTLTEAAFKSIRFDLRTPRQGTIVIGADVTHPGAGCSDGTPSIAGVVGSTDSQFVHFPGSMRLQRSKKEEIVELGDMVKERLVDWANKHDGVLPGRMLFYRDGVSENQYDKLQSFEIPQIQSAFNWAQEYLDWKATLGLDRLAISTAATRPPLGPQSGAVPLGGDGWPVPVGTPTDEFESKAITALQKQHNRELTDAWEQYEETHCAAPTLQQVPFELTYVVVGKRHNVRFFPKDDDEQNRHRNGNVKPGLVVERVVTHPDKFDFFLQSHNAIKGTARSAHYVCLMNGMGLSADDLQAVTHEFSYVYARSTTGVSYCAPAYYADRLCDRGRAYLRPWLKSYDNTVHRPPGTFKAKLNDAGWGPKRYADQVKNFVRNLAIYSHVSASPQAPLKYGLTRRNPWHPDLDDIMFYL